MVHSKIFVNLLGAMLSKSRKLLISKCHSHFKADDSNANLVEPKGTALYGGEWREHGEDAMGAEDPSDEEKIVLLSEVDGQAAENEEKQSGIFGHIVSSLVAKNLQNQ